MKQNDLINLPFIQNGNQDASTVNSSDHTKTSHNSIYQSFNAKRNASRIDRYFIYLHKAQLRKTVFFLDLFLFFVVLAVFILLTRGVFLDFADDLKDSMVYSIFEDILSQIDYLIVEPNFYCSFLKQLFESSHFQLPSKSTAHMYASILTSANQASAATIHIWKIAIPDGTFIGVKTFESLNHTEWYFSEVNEDGDPGGLYGYQVDEYIRNSSYPYSIGDPHPDIDEYNVTSLYWYELGSTTTKAIWSNLYFPLDNFPPVFSSVISSWGGNPKQMQYILALDLRLGYVQDILGEMIVSNGSRLAITSSDGFVIAIAGSDLSLEESYIPGVITKGIDQLSDPVWRCVSSNRQFRQKANFSVKCNINGTTSTYRIIQSTVHFSETANWTVHAVLNLNEIDQSGETIYNFSFIIGSVICIIIYLIGALISHLVMKHLKTEQTKLLLAEPKVDKKNHHTKPIGIIQAFSDIRRATLASASDNEIIEEMNSVMNFIISSPDMYYYDSHSFLSHFDDDKIRAKMIDVFGFDKNILETNLTEDDSDLIFDDDQNVSKLFANHNEIRNLDYTSLFNHVISIGLRFNRNNNNLFDNDMFLSFLNSHLAMISQDTFFMAADSFDFLELVLKWKTQNLLYDQNLAQMSMYITLIAYFLAMNDRFNNELPYIRKYFLTDFKNLLDIVNKLLVQLPSMMIQNNDFESAKEKWKLISMYSHYLVETTPITRHVDLMNKCRIFIQPTTHQLPLSKSIDLMRFLFNTATVSYLVSPPSNVQFVHSFLYSFGNQLYESPLASNPEHPRKVSIKVDNSVLINSNAVKPLNKPVKEFLRCLNKEYVTKLDSTLSQICGECFVLNLIETSID